LEKTMPITRLDHCALLTRHVVATAEFYGSILGLEQGLRPNFSMPGAWLYCAGNPVLHVVENSATPDGTGPLDHMAFAGSGLAELVERLKARGVAFELRRRPDMPMGDEAWQLFFRDPNGARVEINFAGTEQP
jgi:catechol 2,3-dioxygenase-like lactoylglutathione lyase family enzyme